VTLKDAVSGRGMTVNDVLRVTPLYEPEIVIAFATATVDVSTVNDAVVAPATTATVAGTRATSWSLVARLTMAPPAGAAAVSDTVPWGCPCP
jgi:hypothetical protein